MEMQEVGDVHFTPCMVVDYNSKDLAVIIPYQIYLLYKKLHKREIFEIFNHLLLMNTTNDIL